MRSRVAGRLAALLGLALAASAAPAQAPDAKPDQTQQGSWWTGLFGSKPKPEPAKDAPAPRPPVSKAERARQQERLQTTYWRRSAVCLRLREIAAATNNDALEREALRLDEMAWKLYQTQRRSLGGPVSAAGAGAETPANSPDSTSQERANGMQRRIRSNGVILPNGSDPADTVRGGE